MVRFFICSQSRVENELLNKREKANKCSVSVKSISLKNSKFFSNIHIHKMKPTRWTKTVLYTHSHKQSKSRTPSLTPYSLRHTRWRRSKWPPSCHFFIFIQKKMFVLK
uniref:(northern house mosquito) hypothetical protein n=1 Tax=Culex pipiens TaxID=7175 RepID=A0A8D8B8H5_CULPI